MVKSTYIKVPMITYCYHHNSLFSTAILPSLITPISLLFLPLTSPSSSSSFPSLATLFPFYYGPLFPPPYLLLEARSVARGKGEDVGKGQSGHEIGVRGRGNLERRVAMEGGEWWWQEVGMVEKEMRVVFLLLFIYFCVQK